MQQVSKFKRTEVGQIPEDWHILSLDDISTKIIDIDHNMPKKTESGIPFISVGYLVNRPSYYIDIDQNDDLLEYISQKDYEHYSKRFNAENDDVLYSRFGTIGISKLIHSKQKFIASYSVVLIKPNKNTILPLFLNFTLNSEYLRKQAHVKTQGSSNRNLHLSDIRSLKIILPKKEEQQKIASILSNVDELIQKTEQIIEQTQRLKKGVMQRLLIKGIEHVKFKKTQVGEIPEEWELLTISQLSKLTMGQSPSGNSYNVIGEGIPLLNGPTEFGLEYPTPTQYTTKPTKLCQNEDILLCVRGSTTGRLNLANGTYCIGRGLALIRGLKNKTNTKWLYYHFLRLQKYIYNIASGGGSTFPNINRDLIEKIIIPYPTLKEQQKIASILSTIDLAIQRQQEYKLKIKNLKNGLMQQLLTGKIRVSLKNEQ